MKPPARKSLPKKRNLAAKALREPLFRPKIMANPNAYSARPDLTKNQMICHRKMNLAEFKITIDVNLN